MRRGSARLSSGDLGSKHSFATVTLGGLDQCLIFSSVKSKCWMTTITSETPFPLTAEDKAN